MGPILCSWMRATKAVWPCTTCKSLSNLKSLIVLYLPTSSNPRFLCNPRNSSRPDAILVTPHPTNPKRPLTPPSNR
eukprot:270664-Pelagomonas_calceolata.AAC.1